VEAEPLAEGVVFWGGELVAAEEDEEVEARTGFGEEGEGGLGEGGDGVMNWPGRTTERLSYDCIFSFLCRVRASGI
jgi:hypothetical protein